ncbi:MAG: Dicer-like protein 1 [Cirrosporium novae-zelandiae]|nr:MAG: Dicer-like protein 1 [Cirrosporium novae-zelandiae]
MGDLLNLDQPSISSTPPEVISNALLRELHGLGPINFHAVTNDRDNDSKVIADKQRSSSDEWIYLGLENFEDDLSTNLLATRPRKADKEEEFDSESSSEAESIQPASRKITERRKAQHAVFNQWLSGRVKEEYNREKGLIDIAEFKDEQLSTRLLMNSQESAQVVTSPREYQYELFEMAKKENIIAVLDTGSGKTLIAVLLLKHMIKQELENRALGSPHKISFFLVDNVTLVFQQFAVLENNIDQKVDRFCGEMGTDLWIKETWERHFSENMIIVCTAEVLYWCLTRSFITMGQINVLIFDEAHHAKKNHVYARIIRDFYKPETNPVKRPKVFGMTASPVDAKVDVVQAANDLEALLDCRIATASDLRLLQNSVSRPNEIISEYGRLQAPIATSLTAELEERFGDIYVLQKHFQNAFQSSSVLGQWCADQTWKYCLTGVNSSKIERKAEKRFLESGSEKIEELDMVVKQLHEAQEIVQKHPFTSPIVSLVDLSSKVLSLNSYLQERFERPTDTKCVVFVKRRHTARVLGDLFEKIGTPYLKAGILMGMGGGEVGDLSVSFRQQILTLIKFRKGELNCLFATSVAEEGLDIPDCNLVIRFDLYDTMIQYIQSRGRARHMNSKYVHMIEQGNRYHLEVLKEVRGSEQIMRDFCTSLPEDRRLKGNDFDLEEASKDGTRLRVFTEPKTGAKLTYWSSLAVIAHFASSLEHPLDEIPQVSYHVTFENGMFVAQVFIPKPSPIESVVGEPATRKSIAKRSAAFQACVELRREGYLNEFFLPSEAFCKHKPAFKNALLAITSKKTRTYDARIKPDIWEKTRGTIPEKLFVTILELANPERLNRAYKPLALLTRTELPELPTFPLYLDGGMSDFRSTRILKSLLYTADSLKKLNEFTLRIFRDVFNKTYEDNSSKMSYWLAPLAENFNLKLILNDPIELLDWTTIDYVSMNDQLKWDINKPQEWYLDKFVVDPLDGSRHFFSQGVVPGLGPDDDVPIPYPAIKRQEIMLKSIYDYSLSVWKGKERGIRESVRAQCNPNQPVFKAEIATLRYNLLDEMTEADKTICRTAHLCPQPLKFSALPIEVASMSLVFPAIIHRLESYLIALEACQMLELEATPTLALEAMTKDSDNTEEHQTEQIHFQRGMGKNYERLEFIGDCFLKMATSITIYCILPEKKEFDYHVRRMLMLCNKNLFNNALEYNLQEYIRSKAFDRRSWYPDGIKLIAGRGAREGGKTDITAQRVTKHHLGDKTIADVCEAIIGASLLSHTGSDGFNFDMAVKAVTALVKNPDHVADAWDDYYKLYNAPRYQLEKATAVQLDMAKQVEREHAYKFQFPRLLRSAFTHPTHPFVYEKIPDYQRLEFLGDALLDMACVNFLFFKYPDRDPQWLTEHKMAMVSNMFLGALSVRLGFHRHMLHNSSPLAFQITQYVAELGEAEREANGRVDYWTLAREAPKCLPDLVEAYIGAMFVDSKFNYQEVGRFFNDHIRYFFEDMSIYDTFANKHPTTYLHNLLQQSFGCANYRVLSQEIQDDPRYQGKVVAAVIIHDQIVADGEAASGKNAKVKASEKALRVLEGLSPREFRENWGCECWNTGVTGKGDVEDTAI